MNLAQVYQWMPYIGTTVQSVDLSPDLRLPITAVHTAGESWTPLSCPPRWHHEMSDYVCTTPLITSVKVEVLRSSRFFVCHSVCVRDYCKSNQPISLKLGVMFGAYQSEELINFWWWSGPGYGFRMTFSTFLAILELGILGDLLAFHIHHRQIFATLGEMTVAGKVVNPQHSGSSDPVNIRIRIGIDREVWTQIPDHFWLTLDDLAEVCALWV